MGFKPKPLSFPMLKPTSLPKNPAIAMAVKRSLLRQSAKAGGGGGGVACHAEYHASAYNEFIGTIAATSIGRYYYDANDGATIVSQSITTTKRCIIVAVGTIVSRSAYAVGDFELEQPLGTIVTDQEHETPIDVGSLFHYSSWEDLPAGTYTYYLVNRSGAVRRYDAAHLKIVAFEATIPPCSALQHANAYNQSELLPYEEDINLLRTDFANGATIVSQSITTTEQCSILAVAELYVATGILTDFELEQPLGTIIVDQEHESADFRFFHYSGWEELPAGTYTYNLVNRSGVVRRVYVAQLKLVAVEG